MAAPVLGLLEDQFLVGSWFTLELKRATIDGITDISGLSVEVAVVDVQQAKKAGITDTRKRPGAVKYGEITLKRHLSADKSLWQWAKDIRDGNPKFREAGAIVLYNIANKEVGRWTFEHAWPSKWSASDLDVGSDDPVTEEVTLVVEMLRREK
jgi:phage tail-like protein